MTAQTRVAKGSSIALRVVGYLFLQWFPGPAVLPASIFALFAVYVPAFISSYLTEPAYDVVDDEVDIIVKEATVQPTSDDGTATETANEAADSTENGAVVAEEVDVEETLVLRERPVSPWQTLLVGAPNPTSLFLTLVTFAINIAIVAMTADTVYRARIYYPSHDLSFVRLGYVSYTDASFVLREPDQSKMPVTLELRIKDPQPPFDLPVWWSAGGMRWSDNSTDFTVSLTTPLKHSKQRVYEWRTSNNHSGEFIAPPKPGDMPTMFDGKFTFLTTSCIIPRFPYNPLDHPLSIPGLRYLAKLLPSLQAQFMLFLGDFIYVDVPLRMGKTAEDYRQKYRHVYASPDWAPVGQNLSWIHVLDDHEISNDWSANSTGVYEVAVNPWHHYHAAVNPPRARQAGTWNARRSNATWFEFAQGPASFFMLDTRSYRSSNKLPFHSNNKTMLGPDQLEDIITWLKRSEPKGVKWKIVASSVPFTKNWPVNTQDTWGGFLYERKKILEAMWDAGTKGYGVVVISGDRHEFAATKFPPPLNSSWPETAAVHEFSVSPLNQFSSPVPSYRQTDDSEVMIKYIHAGNSKFGAITIESLADGDQSSLKYRLFINGEEKWDTIVLSPPVPESEKGFWSRFTRP